MAEALLFSSEDRNLLQREPVRALLHQLRGSVYVSPEGTVELDSADALRSRGIDVLVLAAVFDENADVRDAARWIIGETAGQLGLRPASIDSLYRARGRGEVSGFTVPAINVRAATYDTGRALFAAARDLDVGALILEIARSEIGYTDQRPAEYVAVLSAAAIKEGWTGPLFFQGDHVQVNARRYAADPRAEIHAVCALIREQVHAGFYNIDIDTSTLVDLSRPSLEEQQRVNFTRSAEFTEFIRRHEPAGVTISVGGEIGEVGSENSTPAELRAYMDGYQRELERLERERGRPLADLSKISVQSGTSHGGVVLPDGSIAEVAIDFDTLRSLSELARRDYHLSGAVQHGASTLPDEAFEKFPQLEVAEIHLATGFQNRLLDHEAFPVELRERMYAYCRENCAAERKPKDTEQQFLYKTRKKALGVFKRELWGLPEANRREIRASLYDNFAFLFRRLRVERTSEMVRRWVRAPEVPRSGPATLRVPPAVDDWELAD